MQIGSPTYSALNGIRTGMEGLARNAQDIAGGSVASPQQDAQANNKVVDAMVDQTVNANQTQASIKSFATADDMIGTLLDVHA